MSDGSAALLILLAALGWAFAAYLAVAYHERAKAHIEAQRSRGELSRENVRLKDRIIALRTGEEARNG